MNKYLQIVFLCFLIFIVPTVDAQVLLNESFEGSFPPAGWILQNAAAGNNWSQNIIAANAVSGTKSMVLPVAPNDNNAWAISPAINLIAGERYRVSYWYKTTSSLYSKTLKVTMGNTASLSGQTTVLHNYASIVNTSFMEGVDFFTASVNGNFYFGFNSAYYHHAAPDGLFVDSIVIQKIQPCTGIPPVGTASGPSEICAGSNFTINMNGGFIDDNIVFQWQSSPPGENNFSDITGATSQSLTASQVSAKDYRCKIICANTGQFSVSNIVQLALKPSDSCYCTPTAYCPDVNPITNIKFAGINNSSSCVVDAYGNYTGTVPPANVTGGTTVPISVKVGKNVPAYAAAWIDFNDNGLFETNEYTDLGSGNDSIVNDIFIPSATAGGLKRMRVRLRPAQKLTANDACTFITAETEDYKVMVTPAKIIILYTPFTDTLYDPVVTITARLKQRDVGLNVSDSLGPRIWVKRENSTVWKSFKGTLTSGTANDGIWQFPVNHDTLGIRHNGCDSVQYYFVAQDLSDTAYIGYFPEPGALHTDVRTQINPPPVLFGYRLKPRLKDTILVSTSDCRYQSLSNDNGLFEEIGKRKLEGDLTIIIGSDLSENGFYALKDSFQNGHSVTIRPDGNTVRSITHDFSKYNPEGQTGILKLIGAKKVAVDGSYQNEGGYLRFISQPNYTMGPYDTVCSIRISDDADSIIIKNCSFRMDHGSLNIAEASVVAAQGINKNIFILNNEFSNITASKMAERHLVSINGTNSLTIKGNRFDNYRQSAINIAAPASNCVIDSNHFFRTTVPTDYSYSTEAINVSGGGHLITGNYIGGSAPFCAGSPMSFVDNPASNIVGIKISPAITDMPNLITNNRIDNINATTGGAAAEAASFAGILCVDNRCIIKDNTIGNPLSATPSITILADQIFGIQSYGSQDNEISNNIISGLKNNGITGAIRLYGIYQSNVKDGFTAATASSKIQHNKIFNLNNTLNTSAINSSVSDDLGGTAGIYVSGGAANSIEQNEIHNISVTKGHLTGVAFTGGPATPDTTFIRRNNVYDLYNTSSLIGSCCGDDLYNGIINGIGINWGNYGLDIINNRISVSNRGLASPVSIRGIFEANSNVSTVSQQRILYNSVYIGGTATDNGGSAGYFSLYSRIKQVYNNIFYTGRTGGAKGHYAYRFVGNSADLYPRGANNNLYVLPDTSLFADRGNNFFSNFATWKSLAHIDNASYFTSPSVMPSSQFFIDKENGNLNIDTTENICWYVNGKALPFAGITADFDSSVVRSDAIQNGATDIGSDEFSTSTVPPALTVFGRHVPGGADTLSCNGRIVAVITWGDSGILPSLGNCRWYSGVWPNDTTNNGTVISANYLNAYWSIPATGGANYTYSLKLFYDSSILGKISVPQNMVINKKQINVPGTWEVITPTINNTSDESLTVNGQTSFSEFTATDLLYALPVNLVLNGRKVDDGIRLTWQDENGGNILSYGIERSTDGIKFSNIGNVTANNNAYYQYDDKQALKIAPVLYYRLRIIDADGKAIFSNVIIFRNELNGEEILNIYPNPFKKKITLKIISDKHQAIHLRLLSANGYKITDSELNIAKGNNMINMNVPDNIPPGNYILRITTEKGSYSFKLIKN